MEHRQILICRCLHIHICLLIQRGSKITQKQHLLLLSNVWLKNAGWGTFVDVFEFSLAVVILCKFDSNFTFFYNYLVILIETFKICTRYMAVKKSELRKCNNIVYGKNKSFLRLGENFFSFRVKLFKNRHFRFFGGMNSYQFEPA